MSVYDKLVTLAQSMNFGTKLRDKIDAPPDRVLLADTTDTLSNNTLTAVENLANSVYNLHVGFDGDPHETTADQVGVYTIPVIDQKLNDLLGITELPLSRIGTLNYAPLPVYASDESFLTVPSDGGCPMHVEDDGTLVYLTIATNGTTRDMYYRFFEGFHSNVATISSYPITSTKKYRPKGFPDNAYVHKLFTSVNGIIVFCTRDLTTSAFRYWVAVTNGTFDDDFHDLYEIAESVIGATNQSYCSFSLVNHPTLGKLICCVKTTPSLVSASFGHTVFTCPMAGVTPGDMLSFTELVGWASDRQDGTTVNAPAIAMFDRMYAVTPAASTNSFVYSSVTGFVVNDMLPKKPTTTQIVNPTTGVITVIVAGTLVLRTTNAVKPLATDAMYSFNIDLVAKTATLNNKTQLPITVGNTSDVISVLSGSGSVGEYASLFTGNIAPAGYVATPRYICSLNFGRVNEEPTMRIHQFNTDVPAYTAVMNLVAPSALIALSAYRPIDYGSASYSLQAPIMIDNTRLLVAAYGDPVSGTHMSNANELALLEVDLNVETQQYYSIEDNQFYPGPVSSVDISSQRIADPSLQPVNLRRIVQYHSAGNYQSRGGLLGDVNYLSRPLQYSASSTVVTPSSARIVVSSSVMDAAKNAIYTALGISAQIVEGVGELFFPQGSISGSLKPIMFVTIRTTTGRPRFYAYNATVTSTVVAGSITVTNITPTGQIYGLVISAADVATPLLYNDDTVTAAGHIHLKEFTNSWAMAFVSGVAVTQYGLPLYNHVELQYNKTSNLWITLNAGVFTANATFQNFFIHPVHGLGYVLKPSSPRTDRGTKLLFVPVLKTQADIDAGWDSSRYASTVYALGSNDEVKSKVTLSLFPALVNGKLYNVPALNADVIGALGPGITTKMYFYLTYGITSELTLVFSNYSTPLHNRNALYVGSMTMNGRKVVAQDFDCATILGPYRLSEKPRGSSIPVSRGLPHDAGDLDPEWIS